MEVIFEYLLHLFLLLVFAIIGIGIACIFGEWLMERTSKKAALLWAIVLGRIILHITLGLERMILG